MWQRESEVAAPQLVYHTDTGSGPKKAVICDLGQYCPAINSSSSDWKRAASSFMVFHRVGTRQYSSVLPASSTILAPSWTHCSSVCIQDPSSTKFHTLFIHNGLSKQTSPDHECQREHCHSCRAPHPEMHSRNKSKKLRKQAKR